MAKQSQTLYRCTCGFETDDFDSLPGHSATVNSDSNHDYREAVRIHTVSTSDTRFAGALSRHLADLDSVIANENDDEFYRLPGYRSSTEKV